MQDAAEEKLQDRLTTRRGSIAGGRARGAAGAGAGAGGDKTRKLMRDRFNFLRIVKKQLSDQNSAFKAGNDVTLPDTLKKFGTPNFEVGKYIQNFYKVNNPAFAAEHANELHQRKALTRYGRGGARGFLCKKSFICVKHEVEENWVFAKAKSDVVTSVVGPDKVCLLLSGAAPHLTFRSDALKKFVAENYTSFIATSREIVHIESDMIKLTSMLNAFKMAMKNVEELSFVFPDEQSMAKEKEWERAQSNKVHGALGDEMALNELAEDLRSLIYERKFEKAVSAIETAFEKGMLVRYPVSSVAVCVCV